MIPVTFLRGLVCRLIPLIVPISRIHDKIAKYVLEACNVNLIRFGHASDVGSYCLMYLDLLEEVTDATHVGGQKFSSVAFDFRTRPFQPRKKDRNGPMDLA